MLAQGSFPCKLACQLIWRHNRHKLIAQCREPQLYEPYYHRTSRAYRGLLRLWTVEIYPRQVGDILGGSCHLIYLLEPHFEESVYHILSLIKMIELSEQ